MDPKRNAIVKDPDTNPFIDPGRLQAMAGESAHRHPKAAVTAAGAPAAAFRAPARTVDILPLIGSLGIACKTTLWKRAAAA